MQTLKPQDATTVARREFDHELCEISALLAHDQLVAYEYTTGPLTLEIFNAPWREHLVTVESYDASFVLGPCTNGPLAALLTFFQAGSRDLADYMDLLDGVLIPYRYDLKLGDAPLLTRKRHGEAPK